MSIKNPLLEKYSAGNKRKLESTIPAKSSLLKLTSDGLATGHLRSSLTSSVLMNPSNLLLNSSLKSNLSLSTTLSQSTLTSYSSSSPSKYLSSKDWSYSTVTKSMPIKDDSTANLNYDNEEINHFLDSDNFIPLITKSNVLNNYFETQPKEASTLTKEELAKQEFINLAACSLIHMPKFDNKDDPIRIEVIKLTDNIASFDPEFILKTSLFTRKLLNIRVTANFLVALAAYKKPCRPYIKKYFDHIVVLPSDWIDIAELYTSLGDKSIGFSSLPVCLRKAMTNKFPSFDEYQIGKYNKKTKKKDKTDEDDDDDEETKLYERQHFTLKQLVRKLHMFDPPNIIMPILGKKYPETQDKFYRSRLPGNWDEQQAGIRMKVPIPYTWETQLAANGNNKKTWKDLILSKKLPYMAMLRNLRNIILSGVDKKVHKIVQRKLSSRHDIKNSKQFPFRFLSAYAVLDSIREQNNKDNIIWSSTPEFEQDVLLTQYKECLDKAVQVSAIHNVKPIKGSLLILFDCSDIMDTQCSAKGFGLTRTIREVAGLMTLMCMFSSEHCDLVYHNNYGIAKGKKLETGGEILKFLGQFVNESNEINTKLRQRCRAGDSSLKLQDYLCELIEKEIYYDMIIHICSESVCHERYMISMFREKVNHNLLFVHLNMKTSSSGFEQVGNAHDNDVFLSGFSDQMLKYISERGSGELLSNVESIDKTFNLKPLPRPMALNYVSPLTKNVKSKILKIFVSSTFLDLEYERKELMQFIIPSVNKLVMKHHCAIQEVDLRWGITKEEASSHKVILRCLEELDRCHYFLCIIGMRYGTTFDTYPESPNPTFSWLKDHNCGLSMTEIEVRHALMFTKKSEKLPPGNMMFMIKKDINDQELNATDVHLRKLTKEIKRAEASIGVHLRYYTDETFHETATDLLKTTVIQNVLSIVTDNRSEEDLHASYVEKEALLFVGRHYLLKSLSEKMVKGGMLLLTGAAGTGKSALLARAFSQLPQDTKNFAFQHVVKVSPESKNLKNLLTRLCFHLSKINNEPLADVFDPISTFWRHISKCETPFTLMIDGCDELLPCNDLFSWLPDKFPNNITVVFTATNPGPWLTYLNKKYTSISTFDVPKLSITEKAEVTKELLAAYGKNIETKGYKSQLSLLLSKRDANNPLFIDLCINQLRLNAVFENLTQCIQELPETTEDLYIKILNIARKEVTVSEKILVYLYCSKNGISEFDMLVFLQIKPLALSYALHYLQIFISNDQSTGVITLLNQFTRRIVFKNCFNDKLTIKNSHRELAQHYHSFIASDSKYYSCARKEAYQCVLFHYCEAGDWKIVVDDYLSDFNFIRQMIYLGLLDDILSIFNVDVAHLKPMDKVAYKSNMSKDRIKVLHQFFINNKNILVSEPYLLQQRMLLQLENFEDKLVSDIQFNNFIGNFKSLKESKVTSKCMMNECSNSVISCMSVLPTSSIILAGFHDSKFQVFDVSNGKVLQTYRGHTGPVTCCGFLTSSRFVSGGSDGSLKLWALADTICLASISPHIYPIQDIAVNSITKCVISAGIDRRVTVWHNDVIYETIDFENPMNCISFIQNGKKLIAGSWTGEIYAYDLVKKIKISVKSNGNIHRTSIQSLCSGKKQFIALDITGVLSVWDQETLYMLKNVKINNIMTLSYDYNDNIIYGLNNGIIHIAAGFGEMSLLPIQLEQMQRSPVTALHQNVNIGWLIAGYYSGQVVSIDTDLNQISPVTWHKGRVNAVITCRVSGCTCIVSCSDDGTVHVYNPETCCITDRVTVLEPHNGKVLALCAGSDENVIFSGGYDCAITATKLGSEAAVTQGCKLFGHQAPVSSLLHMGDKSLISGSHDGSVKLWNSTNGQCLYTADTAHTDWVTCSATAQQSDLTQSFRKFVTGSNDNLAILWMLESSKIVVLNKLLGHSSPVTCVSLLLDTKRTDVDIIMAGAQDGSIILWNKDGKFVSNLQSSGAVNTCTVVPNSQHNPTAYIGTVDGKIKCMQPSKLDVISTFTHHTGSVKQVCGLQGNLIGSISTDNTLQVWSWGSDATKSSGMSQQFQAISDIKWCEVASSHYRVGVMDKTGALAEYTIKDDSVSCKFRKDPPEEASTFGLIPPSSSRQSAIHVPERNLEVLKVLTNEQYTLEVKHSVNLDRFSVICDSLHKANDFILSRSSVCTCVDITNEGIIMVGEMGGNAHLYAINAGKRLPTSAIKELQPNGVYYSPWNWISAVCYVDGKTIVGTTQGQLIITGTKRANTHCKVFSSTVTAIQCVFDRDGDIQIFAGGKDGVIKVLTDSLKVVGMFHTNGAVQALKVLYNQLSAPNNIYVVAGDKCGSVHFLKWLPPTNTSLPSEEEDMDL